MPYVLNFLYVGIYWNKPQYGSNPSLQSKTYMIRT